MAYRLDLSEGIGNSLRRVAGEQLDGALEALADDGAGVSESGVHTARKSLKKTRSLVRLSRPALGGAAYRLENAALRDAGRVMSGTRDADVMVATAASLAERGAGLVPSATFAALADALAARAEAARAGAAEAAPAAHAREGIAEVRGRVALWPLDDVGASTLVAGLRRAYERGHAALDAVRDDPRSEASHDWRKRVKDLWYQQRLVAPSWPEVLDAQAEQAHVLSELLGDDHDLAVLRDHLAGGEIAVDADLEPVIALADRRRDELMQGALELGARVYAEPPRAFERRIRAYVRAAWSAAPARA